MLLLRQPSPTAVNEFLKAEADLDLSYEAVGATAAVPPTGYTVDRRDGE